MLKVSAIISDKLVECLAQRDAKVVVDPTLLLLENDWAEVCAERIVKGNYILVYQLGFSKTAYSDGKKSGGQINRYESCLLCPFPLGGIVKSRLSIQGLDRQYWLSLVWLSCKVCDYRFISNGIIFFYFV